MRSPADFSAGCRARTLRMHGANGEDARDIRGRSFLRGCISPRRWCISPRSSVRRNISSRSPLHITIVILSFAALSGCLDQFRGGEGEESLAIVNRDDVAVEVIARMRTVDGSFMVFSEDVVVEPGGSREYVLALRPATYILALTTSTEIDERFYVEIPSRGDTHWTLAIVEGGATLSRA